MQVLLSFQRTTKFWEQNKQKKFLWVSDFFRLKIEKESSLFLFWTYCIILCVMTLFSMQEKIRREQSESLLENEFENQWFFLQTSWFQKNFTLQECKINRFANQNSSFNLVGNVFLSLKNRVLIDATKDTYFCSNYFQKLIFLCL